jgi:hypothetical protein
MPPNDNRRPAEAPGSGGDDYEGSRNSAKVIRLPTKLNPAAAPFDGLTVGLVLAQLRAGTLPESVLLALLACAGLRP